MYFVTFARKYPICAAVSCFALGGVVALLGVRFLGTPWNAERPVEKLAAQPAELPATPLVAPPVTATKPGRADLVVMQAGKSSGLNSDFGEYFVEQARKLPGVDQVSEGVVDVVDLTRDSGISDPVLVQGWNPDNFGFESLQILSGRKLRDGDTRHILLGHTLAANLNKKIGDKLVFGGDRENPYEIVGSFKSSVTFANDGAIIPFKEGQLLTGKRVTGFSVRVKKTAPDPAAEIEAVRQKIEALRDPKDPTTRLSATTLDSD